MRAIRLVVSLTAVAVELNIEVEFLEASENKACLHASACDLNFEFCFCVR